VGLGRIPSAARASRVHQNGKLVTVKVFSMPLNYTIFMHPDKLKDLFLLPDSYVTVSRVKNGGRLLYLKSSNKVPKDEVYISKSVQLSLKASSGDLVSIVSADKPQQVSRISISYSPSIDVRAAWSTIQQFFQTQTVPVTDKSVFYIIHASSIIPVTVNVESGGVTSRATTIETNQDAEMFAPPEYNNFRKDMVLPTETRNQLRSYIELPVSNSEHLADIGVENLPSTVIYGTSQSGKTSAQTPGSK
jgi:hypothetical protein